MRSRTLEAEGRKWKVGGRKLEVEADKYVRKQINDFLPEHVLVERVGPEARQKNSLQLSCVDFERLSRFVPTRQAARRRQPVDERCNCSASLRQQPERNTKKKTIKNTMNSGSVK